MRLFRLSAIVIRSFCNDLRSDKPRRGTLTAVVQRTIDAFNLYPVYSRGYYAPD